MVSPLFFYQLVLVALVWLCVMLHVLWPSDPATCPTTLPPPLPKRHRAPKPFAGLTAQPHCDACEHAIFGIFRQNAKVVDSLLSSTLRIAGMRRNERARERAPQ